MEWKKFENLFHQSWWNKMKPFIESNECNEIYAFLKKESMRGKQIAPLSSNVYRCFKETPLDQVKFVMVGMSPYHTFKDNLPVADGLLMGCSTTGYLQPSLDNFYKALEKEFHRGLNLSYEKTPDVRYLANQGVLMLNAALTTEKNKAGSHIDIWEPFIKYLFEEVLNPLGVPFLFLGKDAAKYKKYTGIFSHTFVVSHPASAAYKGVDWDSEDVFTKIDTLIYENNGFSINWLKDAEYPF
jgi:uracil-DNA glycosylase